MENIPFSVLDLSPIVEGSNASEAFQRSLRLAQKVEELGYNRFWVAEHRNMPGIASSATSVHIFFWKKYQANC